MPDQIQLVVKSLKDFKNNLIILVPMLLSFGAIFLLAVFIFLQIFLGALIFRGSNFYESASVGVIVYIAFFALLDFILYLLLISYITAAYYGTAADVVVKGKSSFKRLLRHGKTFLKPVLAFFIANLIIVVVPIELLSIIVFSAFLISSSAGYIALSVSILLYILFVIAFSVLTLFINPILISRKIGGFRLIVESLKYGKSNFEHVIITLAVSIVLGIISMVIYSIFYVPSFIMRIASESMAVAASSLPLALGAVALELLASIVSSICGIIIMLYIFNSYFSRNPIKNWK